MDLLKVSASIVASVTNPEPEPDEEDAEVETEPRIHPVVITRRPFPRMINPIIEPQAKGG